jgi:hypothetical protein
MPTFQPVTFTNPADASTYVWPHNPDYDAETQAGSGYQQKQRQIERTSNTGNIGATRQQGDDGSFILAWDFTVFTEAHEQALWHWYELCRTQSIYLTDFNSEQYEGQIIDLSRIRQGALGGPGDTNHDGFYREMTLQFDVWRFISGTLASAGVVA